MLDKQLVLRPADLLVLLKLGGGAIGVVHTYDGLGASVGLSASQVHRSVQRARAARLMNDSALSRESVSLPNLRDFLVFGARYAFPAVSGSVVRGMPTAHAAEPLRSLIVQSDDLPPVWPTPEGVSRGVALTPIHSSVPFAANSDPRLYELLSLLDAIRAGTVREREIAIEILRRRLL